jgi:hypothetical protein
VNESDCVGFVKSANLVFSSSHPSNLVCQHGDDFLMLEGFTGVRAHDSVGHFRIAVIHVGLTGHADS